jgi:hypothetical protein
MCSVAFVEHDPTLTRPGRPVRHLAVSSLPPIIGSPESETRARLSGEKMGHVSLEYGHRRAPALGVRAKNASV